MKQGNGVRYRHAVPLRLALAATAILAFSVNPALATVMYTVTIDDPGTKERPANFFAAYYDPIKLDVLAAGARWSQFLVGDATIDLQIGFSGISTAEGSSVTTGFVGTLGTLNVFEQGAAAEVRTGIDPNGASPDGVITIGTNYLVNELAFDSHTAVRSDQIPAGKTDAVSVFLHEIGHVLAINGFRSGFDGSLPPGDFESTFDVYTTFDGTNLFFNGPKATALYGQPVPLTFGDYPHLGNAAPRPGSDLIPDLMNGVQLDRETRYDISLLDLAILCDVGVPGTTCQGSVVPEPSTWLLFVSGLIGLVLLRSRLEGQTGEPSSLGEFQER
jgi:hypothetical protein